MLSPLVVFDSLQPYGLCSPPGSSVHGLLQARILEWVAISYPREDFFFNVDHFFLKSLLNLLQYFFCFMFLSFGNEACGILAPRSEIETASSALKGGVLTT